MLASPPVWVLLHFWWIGGYFGLAAAVDEEVTAAVSG